jgi:hypothetical protein
MNYKNSNLHVTKNWSLLLSARDDNLTGPRTITRKCLHMLNGTRSNPTQEAVHMVDNQDLVICSDMITYVSLAQGQALRSETDRSKQKDLITVYRNRKEEHYPLSMEQYFYQVFVESTFNKSYRSTNQHRILMPKGMNCKPRYTKWHLIMYFWGEYDTVPFTLWFFSVNLC